MHCNNTASFAKVMEHFAAISAIPRGSGNEEAIAAHIEALPGKEGCSVSVTPGTMCLSAVLPLPDMKMRFRWFCRDTRTWSAKPTPIRFTIFSPIPSG